MLCHYYTNECSEFPPGLHPCCVSHMLEMLNCISNIFDENSIPFFITYGTLLGWRRHNGIIPWDDDIDIACMRADVNKILRVVPEIEKCGFEVNRVRDDGSVGGVYPSYDYFQVVRVKLY